MSPRCKHAIREQRVKAYQLGEQNGIEALTPVSKAEPQPGAGQVVVAPSLICLNNRDLQIIRGVYGARKATDRVPMSEGVGKVVAVGEGVTGFQAGDRVTCSHFVNWLDGDFFLGAFAHDIGVSHDGWLAERVVIPASALVRVPDSLSDERAAPLSAGALTAWHAVVEVGKVKAGDLVLGLGTGGVSIAALQIAKAAGARFAITSSSDEKLELARKLGADILVNYRTHQDWAAELMRQTGNAGADIVVETGGQDTLPQSINAAAVNARIVLIGVSGGQPATGLPNYGSIIGKNITIKGIAAGSRAMLARYIRAVDANGIEPVIDRVFPFDDAPAAYAYLAKGEHVGKVLIDLR